MRITTQAKLNVGDRITISGVHYAARRTRWQRFCDWILRRAQPGPALQEFRVTQVITSTISDLQEEQP